MRITGVSVLAGLCSVAFILTGSPAQAAAAPTTTIIDVAADGTDGNGFAGQPTVSADGRYVAYTSGSSNLVPGDTNGYDDIFVRDTVAGTTTLVSVGLDGTPGNDASYYGVGISADGRYVAFASNATNLVPGDTNNCGDVFLRDLQTGATTRVSLFTGGEQINGTSDSVSISADGRYVGFTSYAPSLGGSYAFVHDTVTGTTTRVSPEPTGNFSHDTYAARLSADGKFMVFQSWGDVLGDGGHDFGIFVHDLTTGTTVRASVTESGKPASGTTPSISADGTKVAFESSDALVASDANGWPDIYVRDLTTGTTALVSATPRGQSGDRYSQNGTISADGRQVAFHSLATDLTSGHISPSFDVYLRDLSTSTTTMVSVDASGAGTVGESMMPVPTADGSRVVYLSVPTVTANARHVALTCLRDC